LENDKRGGALFLVNIRFPHLKMRDSDHAKPQACAVAGRVSKLENGGLLTAKRENLKYTLINWH